MPSGGGINSRRWVAGKRMSNQIPNRALAGQVALVTGAGRRIGREIALALGRAGAVVAVNYNQSWDEAQTTVNEIKAGGSDAVALQADVARPAQVRRMFHTVERKFGQLDLLVNNAAIFFPVKWDQLTEKQWDRILAVNLKGPFFCAQEAGKLMQRRNRGQIINISSLGGLQAWPDYVHYCTSKAGLIMLTRCLAKALAPGIRVNSIAPGTILFPGEKKSLTTKRVIRSTPARKAGRPEDIANMVLHLACHGEFITGQIFPVDGGKSIP
jgi:pteridine reductase